MSSTQPKSTQVSFKNSSETVTVYAAADGSYTCPVCNKSGLKTPSGLKRHVKIHEMPETALDNRDVPQPLPTSNSGDSSNAEVHTMSELVSEKKLQSLGYVINTRGRFLVCIKCEKPVLPCFASGHSHDKHEMPRFDEEVLKPYILKYNLFEDAVAFEAEFFKKPLSLHPAFEGVKSETVYRCKHRECAEVRGTLKSAESHWRGDHAGLPFQQPTAELGQQMNLDPHFRRWLPVRVRLTSVTMDDALQACLDAYFALPKDDKPVETNTREPPPWLRKLGWVRWIQNYDAAVVDGFVESVKKNAFFKRISDILTDYLKKGMILLDDVQIQIRQILKSVTKDITSLMFSAPDSEETLKRYATLMAFIITSHLLLQVDNDPPLPRLLNPKQTEAIQELYEFLMQDNPEVSVPYDVIHNVVMSMLLHEFEGPQIQATGDPVLMALVWYNRRKDGSFKQPGDITQTFAAVQFVARCSAMIHAQTQAIFSDGESNIYEEIGKLHPLMLQGSRTPLGNIYSYWIILLRAAMQEIGFASFMYTSADDLSFTYKGSPGTVEQLCKMIHHHINRGERILFQDILFGLDIPILSKLGDHIYDDTANTDVDYSFLTDKRNGYPNGFQCVMEAMFQAEDRDLHKFFGLHTAGGWVWNKVNCIKWLEDCQRFLRHLLVASHMTHGQPTRGTELMSTTIANMQDYPRSIMIVMNEAVNALTPSKPESMTQQRKLSPHWFCPQNSRQLFVYLLLVRPVEIAITRALFPHITRNYEYYLYTGLGGPWESKDLSSLLYKTTQDFLGIDSGFGLADMRQILIALYYRHCNSLYLESESKTVMEAFAEEIGDRQANHSSQTRRAHYGIQKSEMGSIPTDKVRAIRMYSRGVHEFWKVGRPRSDTEAASTSNAETNVDHRALLVALQHEFNDVKDGFKMSLADMKKWLVCALQDTIATAANAIVKAIKDDTASIPSYDHFPSASLLASLRKWQPTHTQFRSDEQALALARVMERKEHQLVILPTGEGKSLLWMLPAQTCWLDKVVVVVTPFVALKVDLEERCRSMGISCSRWPPSKGECCKDHGVVFVSVEHAITDDFHGYARSLIAQDLLATIVLDECHLVLAAGHYRTGLPFLRDLYGLGQPILCTTATLPPHLVPEFKKALNVSHIQVTRRINKYSKLRISVDVKKNCKERMEAAIKKAREWLPILRQRKQSAMVICRTTAECEEIAAAVDVDPYHGSLDVETKVKRFHQLRQGNNHLLVATTALTVGVDFPNIVGILFVGPMFDMTALVQALGRMGRGKDVATAFCHMIVDVGQQRAPVGEDLLGVKALNSMIFDKTVCRKLSLTAFMEGTITSCLSGHILCDVCQEGLEREGCQYEGPRDLSDEVSTEAQDNAEPVRMEEEECDFGYIDVEPAVIENEQAVVRNKRSLEDMLGEPVSSGRSVRARTEPSIHARSSSPKVLAPDTPPRNSMPGTLSLHSLFSSDFSFSSIKETSEYQPSQTSLPSTYVPSGKSSSVKTASSAASSVIRSTGHSHSAAASQQHSAAASQQRSAVPSRQHSPAPSQQSVASSSGMYTSSFIRASALPFSFPSASVATAMQTQQTKDVEEKVRINEQAVTFVLDKLKNVCIVCWLTDNSLEFGHTTIGCQREERHRMLRAFKGVLVPKAKDRTREWLCYKCYIPSKNPEFVRFKHSDNQGNDGCELAHVFRAVMWASWHIKDIREALVKFFYPRDEEGKRIKEEGEWLKYFKWCFEPSTELGRIRNYFFVLLWIPTRRSALLNAYGRNGN